MTDKKTSRSAGRFTVAATNLVTLCLVAAFLVMKVLVDTGAQREKERVMALGAITDYSTNVSNVITNALLVGSAFEGAITLEPEMTQQSFTHFAGEIVKGHNAIVNVATIRDFTLELVHPYEANAHVVGRRLDDIPAQANIAERALRQNKTIFQGPVPLLQGFPGFILRNPILLDQDGEKQAWGLISIVFSAKALLESVERNSIPEPFKIAMRRADDGTPILGDQSLFETDGIFKTVEVPEGAWTIVILPEGGWSTIVLSPSTVLAFILIAAAALATANLVIWLRREATTKTEQLKAAVDVLGDGFTLYDASDRLVIYNERYLDIYEKSAPIVKRGVAFQKILQSGLEHGQYKAAIGREAEWLEERLAAHRKLDSTIEQQLSDGRWLRVREMETPDGGRVGIHVDITDQVESRQRIETAELRLRDAIDAVPAAFLFFDSDGVLEIVNAKALQLFPDAQTRIVPGAPIRKLVERLVYLEFPNAGREHREARVEELLETLRQKTSQFDLHIGNNRYYKIVSQRTQEGGVVCFGVDISDLIAQEHWLESANKRLRAAIKERDAAEARFADVADISTEWFWEQDAEMRLTYLSPGFEKSTGLPIEKALGHSSVELMNRASDPTLEGHLKKMAAHEPFENFIYQSQLRDDSKIWLRTSGKPVFDDNGEFKGYIGTAADVTKLYGALQEAKRADEA
ncbi:MAG: PAS-domain containing protein, partial [Rhodobacteraceae bacterium]|nr:PAS-domain containing protein [Paracoccaceae bacterium]